MYVHANDLRIQFMCVHIINQFAANACLLLMAEYLRSISKHHNILITVKM